MIKLEKLNRYEAVRYLGGAGIQLNYRMDRLMDECEKVVLDNATLGVEENPTNITKKNMYRRYVYAGEKAK